MLKKYCISHGTFKRLDPIIRLQGFKASKGGRIGRGAYFWQDDFYSFDIAKAWVKYLKSKPSNASEVGIVMQSSNSLIDEDRILYISRDLKQDVHDIMIKHGLNIDNYNDISRAYGILVSQVQNLLQLKLQVVAGEVSLPNEEFFDASFPHVILGGRAMCFAVIDTSILDLSTFTTIQV